MPIKISVIIPVYNVQDYLKKCVESVIQQTLYEIQIILVDDGSTDDSGKICDVYEKKDKRITVIHTKNQGVGYARNSGLDIAQGKYIFFVDSDDWIFQNALKELFDLAETNSADIVCFDFLKVFNADEPKFHQADKKTKIVNNKNDLMAMYLKSEISSATWSKLFKKRLWDNLRFTDVKIHEDAWIYHKIIDKCQTAVITNQKYYAYYQRPESKERAFFNENNFICVEVGKRYVQFTREKYPSLINYAYYNLFERQIHILDKMKRDGVIKQFKKEYKDIIKELKEEIPFIKKVDAKNTKRFLLHVNAYFHPCLYSFAKGLKSFFKFPIKLIDNIWKSVQKPL